MIAATRQAILHSICCIGRDDGTRPTACGWGGSESAESSSTSMRSSAARTTMRSRSRKATCHGCAAFATSSRSTPTLSCRDRRAAALIGTIAHPLNRAEYDPVRGRVVARLRHPAAACERVARERERVEVCRRLRGPPRGRSIHDRRLGRVSGSVRRRDVHGEGHLRRGRLSSRDGRPLSRQHACSATISSRERSRARGS